MTNDETKKVLELAREAMGLQLNQAGVWPMQVRAAQVAALKAIDAALSAHAAPVAQGDQARCNLCRYQYGHAIGCENNPVDIALSAHAAPVAREAGPEDQAHYKAIAANYHATPAAPRAPLTDEQPSVDYDALVPAAYALHGYAAGTKQCIAFKRGAEWQADAAPKAPVAPVAPAGWVTVPAEPTPEMAKAGCFRYCNAFVRDYKAMIAVAPAAPVAQPLTEDQASEIMRALNDALTGVKGWGWIDVIRATERAHGITKGEAS